EAGVSAGITSRCVEGDGILLAAADQLGVRNDASIIGRQVVVVGASLGCVGGDGLLVGRLGDHDIVTHGRLGQFAHVNQVDGEVFAGLVHHDFFGVELHRVIAFNGDVALR